MLLNIRKQEGRHIWALHMQAALPAETTPDMPVATFS